jgi:hypothetical protein
LIHFGGVSSADSRLKYDHILSYYLYWYKLGLSRYIIYLIGSLFNSLFNLIFTPFLSRFHRARICKLSMRRLLLLHRLLFDIPRYNRAFGSRPQPLKY